MYDPQYKRILAIEEGINEKKNKTKKDKQKAAQMKKQGLIYYVYTEKIMIKKAVRI